MAEPVYTWLHINEISAEEVQKIDKNAEIVIDGDCGSVWGEVHNCPHPHVLVKNPTQKTVDKLDKAGVPFVADRTEDWGADTVIHGFWLEDDKCSERPDGSGDFRKPVK